MASYGGAYDMSDMAIASTNEKSNRRSLPWLSRTKTNKHIPGEYHTELDDLSATLSSELPQEAPGFAPSCGTLPTIPVPSDPTSKSGIYTPSSYSIAKSVDTLAGSRISLCRKDAASYERLVARPSPSRNVDPSIVPTRTSSQQEPSLQSGVLAPPTSKQAGDFAGLVVSKRRSHLDGYMSSDAGSILGSKSAAARRVVSDATPRFRPAVSHGVPRRSGSLRSAVLGLHGVMEEAMQVAVEAAERNRPDEATAILEQAAIALRLVTNVRGNLINQFPSRTADAAVSDDNSAGTDSSFESSDLSDAVASGQHGSEETVPTQYSSNPESLKSPKLGSYISSLNKMTVSSEEPLPLENENVRFSDSEVSPGSDPRSSSRYKHKFPRATTTKLGLPRDLQRLHHPPSADSIVIDFAYTDQLSQLPNEGGGSLAQARQLTRPVFSDIDAQPEDIEQTFVPTSKSGTEVKPTLRIVAPQPIEEPIEMPRVSSVRRPRRRRITKVGGNELPTYGGAPAREVEQSPGVVVVPVAIATSEEQVPSVKLRVAEINPEERQVSRQLKYKRRPIAREWDIARKRVTAVIACINTALIGLIAGIYAGQVPRIQYQMADTNHRVILGNVLFYIGLGFTTLLAWPLPLLHGRKPYILFALAVTLPLQFPQAVAVDSQRAGEAKWFAALLLPRALSGLALGFAHVNFIATLFDLFGASLQSSRPHQEVVDQDDVRRQGGGVGLWLGLWAWSFVGSLAVGFLIGAGVTAQLAPSWGFYIVVIILVVYLLMNIVAPETRRAPHRRSILHYFDAEDNLQRKIARGEVKLHLHQQGPKYWWEELYAGMRLVTYMMLQFGFAILALYLAWIYALVVLVTLLLGALLSTNYFWLPQFVGLGVFALAIGALLAIPLTKANLFSRDRVQPPRTDSMTFEPRLTWSSHLVRRCIFTFALPVAALAFCLASPGPSVHWAAPCIMSATVGFLSTLAVAECVGLVMETFDTCDLQPGVNSKHRLASLDSVVRRRRTNYSSFPRVIAGLFAAQGIGFLLAAASTGVSGRITRALGAQAATAVVAGILLFLTMLLSLALWRFRSVQVIPNHAFGTRVGSKEWTANDDDKYWKPVIVGNPSGKTRRMNLLETGKWSRWTEVRRLNRLVRPETWEQQGQ